MGPVFFIMAIMGCDDGGMACQQLAVQPTTYASIDACESESSQALLGFDSSDWPTLLSSCKASIAPAVSDRGNARISGGS